MTRPTEQLCTFLLKDMGIESYYWHFTVRPWWKAVISMSLPLTLFHRGQRPSEDHLFISFALGKKTWEGHLVWMSLPSSSFDDSREGERELYCVPAKDCEYGVRPGWKTWVVRCVFPMATTHYSVFRPGHTWIIIVSCVVVFVHIINIDNSSIAPSYDLICEFLQLCFCNQKLPYVISST